MFILKSKYIEAMKEKDRYFKAMEETYKRQREELLEIMQVILAGVKK